MYSAKDVEAVMLYTHLAVVQAQRKSAGLAPHLLLAEEQQLFDRGMQIANKRTYVVPIEHYINARMDSFVLKSAEYFDVHSRRTYVIVEEGQ